jgi:anti-sigma regulatory factor (Ser/Thr protein kinase)
MCRSLIRRKSLKVLCLHAKPSGFAVYGEIAAFDSVWSAIQLPPPEEAFMVTVPPSQYTADPTWAYALELPHDPRAVRIARVTLGAVLAGHGMSQLHDVTELLVSELVTNAYRHSTGPAALRLTSLEDGRLRMSVWDTNPHIPPPFDRRDQPLCPVPAKPGSRAGAGPDVEADSGRGLFLVCQYADMWGGFPLGGDLFRQGGKLLWCEVGARDLSRAGGWAVA